MPRTSRDAQPRVLAFEDYLLLSAIVLLPWAFGGVEIWAFRVAALLLVAGAGVALWKRGSGAWGFGRRSGNLWLLPAFLLAACGAAQIVPLPPLAVRLLSPGAHAIYVGAFPGYPGAVALNGLEAIESKALERVPEAASVPLPEGPGAQDSLDIVPPSCLSQRWRPLSLQPSATREKLCWYVALVLAFVTLRGRFADRRLRQAYLWAIFGNCAALSIYGLVELELGNGKIYWVRPLLSGGDPFGPYVNPNNFAGLMEMVVPGIAGYCWARVRRGGYRALVEAPFVSALILGCLCLWASLASASKAGAFLQATSLFTLGFLGARSRGVRLAMLGAAALAVVLTPFLVLTLRTTTDLADRVDSWVARAEPGHLLEGRTVAWQGALGMVRDFPLTGVGFGAFREVFYRYQPPGSSKRWEELHNDYLEVVVDGGIVTGALILWLIVAYGRKVGSILRRSKDGADPARLGLLLGVGALALHAIVEFNHQIPANALTFVTLAALVVPTRSGRSGHDPSRDDETEGEE